MNPNRYWLFVPLLLVSICLGVSATQHVQDHREELFLKQLSDGRVLAHFEFATRWDMHPLLLAAPQKVNHYGLFPKSLVEVMRHYGVQELHLTLTQGKWRTRVWGYPPRSSPPGAELWTWFLPGVSAERQWKGLVNAMSGLLCASLNFIDSSSTYHSLHSFKPQGAILGNMTQSQMRYAALPREKVCTENFTPWTKLLPCGTKEGLSTLFSALKLYDSEYHSLALHFMPECVDSECSSVRVKLLQTVSVVFLPSIVKNKLSWSFMSLFSRTLNSSCSLASLSRVALDTSGLYPAAAVKPNASWTQEVVSAGSTGEWSFYDVANITAGGERFNLQVRANFHYEMARPPLVNVLQYLTGSEHDWGGLHLEVRNGHSEELRFIVLEMVPWFCRVYLHTLQVSTGRILHQSYTPAKDRLRPHTLELFLSVPPLSTAVVTVQFNRAFLKWTEHPPDAHHGFYINSAVVTTVLPRCPNCTMPQLAGTVDQRELVLVLHTEPILVTLPTPDFSMPYNVLCLVCTIIAIGFGSVFNLSTQTLKPDLTKKAKKGLLSTVLSMLSFGRRSAKGDKKEEGEEEEGEGSKENRRTVLRLLIVVAVFAGVGVYVKFITEH